MVLRQKGFYISAVETALMFQNIERQLGRQVTRDDMELMTWAIYRSGLDISGMEYSKVAFKLIICYIMKHEQQ